MANPGDLGQLKTNELEQLQNIAERLEEAWRQGHSVDLGQFLPPPGDALRPIVLRELIKTELELRWQRGQRVHLESYLEKYPELGSASTIAPELIYEEYRVRQFYGDKPSLSVFEGRFPNQYAQLQQLEQALGFLTPSPRSSQPTPVKERPSGSPQMLPVGGGYKLLRRIGSGGFGEVWLAEAPGGVAVAVKVIFRPLDHDEAQRELQSLELIKGLRHPFLLQTQAYWSFEDRLYIVMELADGSLRDRLKECHVQGLGGIPVAELLRYFREAAEAADFLHRQHVLHRDIKPENILLLQHHAKLADFGLARVQGSQRMVSATGSGTPLYMAPEIWNGKVSVQSDQYSLALTYAELRLDRRLFSGKDLMQIMLAHVEGTPDLAPLPEAEQQVIHKALAKDPERRHANCEEFVRALDGVLVAERDRPIQLMADTRVGDNLITPGNAPAVTPAQKSMFGSTTRAPTPVTSPPSSVVQAVPTALPVGLETRMPPEVGQQSSGSQRSSRGRMLMGRARRAALVGLGLLPVLIAVVIMRWPHAPPSLETGPSAETGGAAAAPTVQPIPEVDWKLAGCEKAKDAKVDTDIKKQRYYDHIVMTKDGQEIDFRLVPRQAEEDPPTFYMMENKVWNDLFRAASKDSKFQDLLAEYEAPSSKWKVKREWTKSAETEPKTNDWSRLPVTRVTVIEAYCFARWLGGNLPTGQEWDKAAGFYEADKGEGPYQQPANESDQPQFALQGKPLPVGTARADVSRFRCHDMAANGVEWTRSLLGAGQSVPFRPGKQEDSVLVRGQSFNAKVPLLFRDLDTKLESEQWNEAAPDISFRVVLEP